MAHDVEEADWPQTLGGQLIAPPIALADIGPGYPGNMILMHPDTLEHHRPKDSPVSSHNEHHIPDADEPSIPELEDDQTIAPRPEEELADELRAEPDVEDHSQHPAATA